MKAILYKDMIQLGRNTPMLVLLIIGVILSGATLALTAITDPAPRMASVMLQSSLICLIMTVTPTCAFELIRSDLANGTIAAFLSSGRPRRQYPLTQFAVAIVPPAALGFAAIAGFHLFVPALQGTFAGTNGPFILLEPLLPALILYSWSMFFKGKAILMTTTTASASITAQSKTNQAETHQAGINQFETTTSPIAVSVQDVSFAYRRNRPVLEHIDLDVPRGQSIGILGYNGVGKTTLFGVIIGTLKPQSGRTIINADVFGSMRDVFQLTDSGNLTFDMTIRENIRFRAMLYATHDDPHPVDLDHLEDLPMVKAFELGDHLDKKVKELSGGLRKRAGIVAGLLFDPHLIMLDEPTNAVDPVTRQLLIALMRQLRADGRTIMTITHDLEYCWEVADRVVMLDDRRIVGDHRIADFPDYESFQLTATPGRERTAVDFGIADR
ncbi:ABC transporter ATP-binding protein [Bifidobacterium simiarum]|uniref:ABC transporter ATP-binding protein n=1 Tax=Bifidobacterium simiarum TaxID=2045441 RepID=UPI001FB04908|nr:ABC transporter ATP-binding protein [Bifidobacterium simiarum]